ncbi:ribonuclease H-like domain-containing protein [Calycina marina]|uniref:Ribonuclease H-like domain-containing protein n=1 Tax=Calycina marina TaxID=1763456 RepID=A0A9P7Z3X1_9HELO|nr:ribonuclease H-like domain-containing protein [Calycina marina]
MVFTTQKTLDRHIDHSPAHSRDRLLQAPGARPIIPVGAITNPSADRRWSAIPLSQHEYILSLLSSECHPVKDLLQNGHNLHIMTKEDLMELRKCRDCGTNQRQHYSRARECNFHPGRSTGNRNQQGFIKFTCCGNPPRRGCESREKHNFQDSPRMDVMSRLARTPIQVARETKYRAVVLDCEMVSTVGGMSEVVIVSVIDYFTGNVLLDTYVKPKNRVTNWASRCHGVTPDIFNNAVRKSQALAGWSAARRAIWDLIDDETIVVGHAVKNDLDVLGMIHHRIVDSAILTRYATGGYNSFGLDRLVKDFLDIDFRTNPGGIHNCMEDVIATREVVLFCTRKKTELGAWANLRIQEHNLKVEQERIKRERAKKNEDEKSKKQRDGKEDSNKFKENGLEDDGDIDGGVKLMNR